MNHIQFQQSLYDCLKFTPIEVDLSLERFDESQYYHPGSYWFLIDRVPNRLGSMEPKRTVADFGDALKSEHVLGNRVLEVKVATPKEEMRQPAKKATRIFVESIKRSLCTLFCSHFERSLAWTGTNESFIGRLPQEATVDDLRDYFGRFGRIQDAYIPKDPKRSGHRGFGLVTFAENGVADRVSRRSREICGQDVAIDSATPLDEAEPSAGGSSMLSSSSSRPEYIGGYGGPVRSTFGRIWDMECRAQDTLDQTGGTGHTNNAHLTDIIIEPLALSVV
ncbi:hypothetical protein Bca101_085190 [Brassica carinata]